MGCRFDEPLLSAAEEKDLARAIEAGVVAEAIVAGVAPPGVGRDASDGELRRLSRLGDAARSRFVRANLRLVHQIAHQEATRCGLDRDELFQEGVVGLLEAIRRWDYRRGLRFTTYAVVWIRNGVHGAAATRLGELNLGRRTADTLHQVRRAVRDIEASGKRATPEAVSRELGIGERAAAGWIAYSAPVAAGDSLLLLPVPQPEPPTEQEVDAESLLASLPTLQRRLLRLRFGMDGPAMTQQQVATAWGWPIGRVRRVERAALDDLRDSVPMRAVAA